MQTTDKWSCGITKIMDTFSGKWRLNLFWIIARNEGIGFNQLRNQIPEITNMMLIRSLDTLLVEGFISKSLSGNKAPFHSEYYLTHKAKELLPLLLKLNEFGKHSD
ncbi:helix-turn-helix domain-containing protein [Leuconostoc sp. MTCC 10508]|uniref:winged helix-turn-helix transcriptional regulator n=1 Tax=Leuconostoc sp. MTCC 10508 TaxID=2698683 RepID=UPI0020BDD869|nr:winged helix-turn-helix transcriptional regulator [Leuconostoc sp. MTCC 10508]